jgi:hypothetical protein
MKWQESDWSKLPSSSRLLLGVRINFLLGTVLLGTLILLSSSDSVLRARIVIGLGVVWEYFKAALGAYGLGRRRQMDHRSEAGGGS